MGLFEKVKVCECFKPLTLDAAGTGDWINLENYGGALIILHITQGGAETNAITIDKAKTAGGGSESTGITINNFWYCADTPQTADTFTKGTAATSITSSNTTSGSSLYVIDLTAAELGDGYSYFQVNCAISAATDIGSCVAILYDAAYPGAAVTGIA